MLHLPIEDALGSLPFLSIAFTTQFNRESLGLLELFFQPLDSFANRASERP
jgi:hypothetical protein